ncbi:N-acyl-D-amino-acid deacylase family protein [Lysobacter gummosus]|uniref:D-aminoacylase n=1 Tax=Lysobacter gummosus TaxID=262324 RepID=A0ABY3XDR7_9GAMM|nr:D-aminoacylase [Lysobacter gummosus]ALN93506.1 D-aminoacylase [Lysobacter gummosus]UNP28955.1 D-aminoacylase [Lysobacter gummosus]
MSADDTTQHDLVIADALVFDGSGGPAYRADVAIDGERIAAIGAPHTLRGRALEDAQGLALAPGFIDVHTHDDRAVLDDPGVFNKLSQGVTTVIAGNCGISLAPWRADRDPPAPLSLIGRRQDFRFERFADYLDAVDAARPAVNVAAMVGHSTLRIAEVADLERGADDAEIERMRAHLREAMRAGAIGFSSGLFYKPSQAAPNSEVIALAAESGAHGGVYASHIRNEYDGVLDALDEAIDAGVAARTPVILSHHKCAGPANWGRTVETLARIDQRRRRHWVGLDAYPYTAGSTVLDPDYVDGVIRIMVSWSHPHPEHAGRDLSDIAADWNVDQKEAARRLYPAGAVYFQMREDDVRRVLSHDRTMIGSDGLPHDAHPHPRLWGAFPRVLGHYCRDEGLFHLAEAIRRMTSLSADTFGLKRRGRIAVGLAADLVLFDPATIADRASFAEPKQAAAGIRAVWVAGACALRDAQATGERRGRALRREEERHGH